MESFHHGIVTSMPDTDPSVPTYKIQPRSNRKEKILVAGIITVVIALLGALGYHFRQVLMDLFMPLERPDVTFLLSAGTLPASVVQFDPNGENPVLLEVPETGEFLKVIDATYVGTSTAYYLIADPLYTRSNIYRQDLSSSNRGLVQITDTDTFKTHLSVATHGDLFAYEVVNGFKSIQLGTYSLGRNTEEMLGEGTRPIVSEDGLRIAFERGRMLVVRSLVEATDVASLKREGTSPYAFDLGSRTVSVYRADTKTIETYSFNTNKEPILISSENIDVVPAALAYAEGTLFYATAATDNREVTIGSPALAWSAVAMLPEGSRFEGLAQYGLSVVFK